MSKIIIQINEHQNKIKELVKQLDDLSFIDEKCKLTNLINQEKKNLLYKIETRLNTNKTKEQNTDKKD